MNNTIITISNDFSFSYEKNTLFKADYELGDIFIERGKIYGIYGKNGCGKTTFLNILNTFLKPTIGKVTYNFPGFTYVHDVNCKKKMEPKLISNNIRRSFQVPFLVDELSTYENILIAKRMCNLETFLNTFHFTKKNIENPEIRDLLALGNFSGNEIAGTLSYGQRRIISNLQLLFVNPQIMIMDEPFVNIHFEMILKLKHEYNKRKTNFNSTIIIVEHTLENLENFVDEIILIKNKKIYKQTKSVRD